MSAPRPAPFVRVVTEQRARSSAHHVYAGVAKIGTFALLGSAEQFRDQLSEQIDVLLAAERASALASAVARLRAMAGRLDTQDPSDALTLRVAADALESGSQGDAQAPAPPSKLTSALADAYRWIGAPHDPSATFEDIAEWFYRETGHMRPGKSLPAEMGDRDQERDAAWQKWRLEKGVAIRQALAEALAASRGEGGR